MNTNGLVNLRNQLSEKKLDGFFVSAVPSITYLTEFSGFDNEDRNAFLLITEKNQYIFTHGIYKEAAQKYIADFTLVDIARNQPMSSSFLQLIEKHQLHKIGFEAADLSYLEYASLAKKIGKNILTPADAVTESIRIKKTDEEIAAIGKACDLGDKAFEYLLTQITAGISEKELALQYEIFIKQHGATLSFGTIVAFGANGSLPHHIPTEKKLTENAFIVLDFGVKLDNYCSDMTRTVYFGKANDAEKHMYETVKTAQEKAITYIQETNPISAAQADIIAREYIKKQGFPEMPHSLGHGIGLLVHERPSLSLYSKEKLEEGMVFSVEPGIYLPDEGGVRIEDLVALAKTGLKQLTNSPKHLIELS